MLVIRYLRTGKKNQPFFRIVVTDKRNPPTAGRATEFLGFYNPLTKEKKLKAERIKYWLSVGAQPSDTVYNLLVSEKVIEGKKIDVHKESKKEKEAAPAEAPAPVKEEVTPAEVKPVEEKPTEEPKKEEVKPVEEKPKEEKSAEESKKEEVKEEKPVEEKPKKEKKETKPKEEKTEVKKEEKKPEVEKKE